MKPIHILLVEDSEGDIVLITEALEEGKISNDVTVLNDGWEAYRYLNRKEEYTHAPMPDLILLDVNLPKMNGHELLVKIKNDETLQHIPVIMLTTSSHEEDVYKAYKNHANCYITKPVDVRKFMEVVSTIENFWISIVQIPRVLPRV